MNVFCLGPEQIDSLWEEFAHHLYRLERLGHLGVDEVREDLRLGKKQLFGVQDEGQIIGIVITRIGGRTCELYAGAGKQTAIGQIEALYREIESWARAIGCARMRVIGRKGWLRKFSDFTQTGVVLEKELT